MPYKFSDNYETVEDIKKEYKDPYKHKRYSPAATGRDRRLYEARMREAELKEYELADQMEARYVTLSIDMRNKYQIKQAINMLTMALKSVENEVFEIPTPAYDNGLIDD